MDELKMNVFIGDLFAGDAVIASPTCLMLIDRPANEFCLCESYNLPVQGTLSTSHTHTHTPSWDEQLTCRLCLKNKKQRERQKKEDYTEVLKDML